MIDPHLVHFFVMGHNVSEGDSSVRIPATYHKNGNANCNTYAELRP